jgi:hypothetical protein
LIIASSVYSRDPITGNITIGKLNAAVVFFYSVTSAKESTGSISFTGYQGDSVMGNTVSLYQDESLARQAERVFDLPMLILSETRDVYARLVRTVSALCRYRRRKQSVFSKSVAGGVANLYRLCKVL